MSHQLYARWNEPIRMNPAAITLIIATAQFRQWNESRFQRVAARERAAAIEGTASLNEELRLWREAVTARLAPSPSKA